MTQATAEQVLTDERLRELYRGMHLIRAIDQRMLALQRQGRIAFCGLTTGQEAAVIGSGAAIEKEDWVFPALREAGVALLRGFPLSRFFAQMFGNSHDVLKGRMQPMHFADRSVNQVSWSSCIATQLPHAVGAAYAMKIKKERRVALAYLGDGASSEHDFHTALNFAGVWRVPCVFVCQNNQWAISVPFSKQTASDGVAVKAAAYGMPGVRVDGNDLLAVHAAVKEAVDRARSGGGPTLVEAVTYRMGGHSSSDDPTRYRDKDEVTHWAEKDPIARFRKYLETRGVWDEGREKALEESLKAEINAAVKEAESAGPPPVDTLFSDVYADMTPEIARQRARLLEEEKHSSAVR
ncbi:MAG TPA: pyruvate dehydrogenase (acetyl-transferring) E1 component subunit alpha [Planctomycetota bacterium]|nr:pyruvate dehydrogenase (acetyl-transferring) E1 component subunit alpha [Planctomycetota bacterium]